MSSDEKKQFTAAVNDITAELRADETLQEDSDLVQQSILAVTVIM